MSGNNVDETAQEIEKLKRDLANKETEITKLTKMNEDAQAHIGKQANEIGDIRKENKEIKDQFSAIKATKGGSDNTDEMNADELEDSLDENQRKLVEYVWPSFTVDEKKKYLSDEKFRTNVLRRAKLEAESVPDTPWKKAKTNNRQDEVNQRLGELFNEAKKKATFVPSGPASGKASATGRGGSATQQAGSSGDMNLKTRSILGPYAR